MTTLDILARDSARAVRASVAYMPVPVRGIVWTTRWFYFRRSLWHALAGSAAAVIAVVALMVVATPFDEVTDVTSPTVTTVAPPTTVTQSTVAPPTIPTESVQPTVPFVVPPDTRTETPPADTVAPRIQILSPDAESRVRTSSIVVVGLTEPGAKVSYADRPVEVGEEGMWSVEVRLEAGQNVLTFSAVDGAGNGATAFVTVTRVVDPPRPTTTTTTTKPTDTTTTTTEAPLEWVFTAHNTYGSCSENPPYDIYFGTAKPGTMITVISDFGGGTTEVGESGEWSIKVFFPEAPSNETFTVKVKDFTGAKVAFDFVNLFVG